MKFVKLRYTGTTYAYDGGSNILMDILSNFLSSDVRFMNIRFYKEWALDDLQDVTGGNITSLEKENDYVYLSDLYSEEKVPTRLKMTNQQFMQILDDWDAKVCKVRPQEVVIRYENDQFSIETDS